ncbi:M20 family metallo-hydrolase [Natronoflexus pectinivorans]|uniref:Acetylornithine deacetylase n=1 Tax=Natronoflexus pectinivorans TaxID=682526 RepID=A0A4R2GP82_9BACT|nr:M20 family metallo-hydrolase [Natronoflexus pectinivorans]TCO10519.1 acetylornithine deacetylase [Natronoflexus pectinivorans]
MIPESLHIDAVEMLKMLISIPSVSRDEKQAADMMEDSLQRFGYSPSRKNNNVWVVAPGYDESRPTILLNSHIDTVKASGDWEQDPLTPVERDGKITGLGSNDAGGPLVALMAAFRYLSDRNQAYNLIFAATAEEEVSGVNNVASILPLIGDVDLGIVGEPTRMQMAVAEKGLLVLDGVVYGKAGHAARNEGVNAIMEALPVLQFFKDYKFEKVSPFLGEVKMTVTGIIAGTQHNVIPDRCSFMVDVRINECYSNQEVFEILKNQVSCELNARSFRLNSSSIPQEHPIVKRGIDMGLEAFGSPTTSDQAVMPFNTLKIGPGDSARSHTVNEYIYIDEIKKGIETYIKLLDGLTF